MRKNIYLILILLSIFFVFGFVLARGPSGSDISSDSTHSDSSTEATETTESQTGSSVQREAIGQQLMMDIVEIMMDIVETLPQSHFVSPLANQTLKGEVIINLRVKDALAVEIYIRRSGALTSIYLGQAAKKGEQTWQYSWQTENYPNGEHKLYAQISNQYGNYESQIIEVIISNPIPLKTESENKAKEIIKEKEEVENEIKEEKSEEKDKLKEAIQEKAFDFKKEIEIIVEEIGPKEIGQEEKKDVQELINQDILPKVEELDDKIEEITIVQSQLKQLETKKEIKEDKKQEEKKKEIEKKLARLVGEKEEIKKDIIEKSERVLEREEVKLGVDKAIENQPEKKVEVLVKREIIKQNIAQQVESLDQSLSSKEKKRQDKLEEMGRKDSDSDGIPDLEEARLGTDLLSPDTDGDGYLDKDEIEHGYAFAWR
jgi:hypothetical protein